MTILLENLAVKWLYRAGSCRYPAETLLYCNLGSSKWFVCVRMCVHDPCLSAQACVGVQMQAWKGNGVFFVLKSWYSGVSVGILHKINWQMIAKDQLGSHLRVFFKWGVRWGGFVDSIRPRSCRSNVFLIYRFSRSYIYQVDMQQEPGGICILQSVKQRLTEETKTTINWATSKDDKNLLLLTGIMLT